MRTVANSRVCFLGPHRVVLQQESLATQLGPHELLVRCMYSLISPGTELAALTRTHVSFEDPDHPRKYPIYPGYAAVGEVEAVGPEVVNFAPGDVVYYRGYHQSYSIVSYNDRPVLPVPPDLPLQLVPFARFGQICNTAVLVSEAREGDVVAVIGLGLIGNIAAQLFRIHGASVIGIDLIAFRRDLAVQAGITHVIEAERTDTVTAVMQATRGAGARTVIEATGNPDSISLALRMARRRGEVILLGSPRGVAKLDVYHLIHSTGVNLKGAHEGLVPWIAVDGNELDRRSIAEQMLRLLQERQLLVEHLISETVGPEEISRGYDLLLSEKDKTMAVLVDWTQG